MCKQTEKTKPKPTYDGDGEVEASHRVLSPPGKGVSPGLRIFDPPNHHRPTHTNGTNEGKAKRTTNMRRSEIEKKDSERATTGKTGGKILIPIRNDNIAIALSTTKRTTY